MRDLHPIHRDMMDISSNRSKVLGAAVVAIGLGALGAYSFASGNAPKPEPHRLATTQVRTTPDYSEPMPPPVLASLDEKPGGSQPRKAQALTRNTVDDEAQASVVQPPPSSTPVEPQPVDNRSQSEIQPSGPQDGNTPEAAAVN